LDKYDLVVVGGGVAGSVAARFAAESGLKTLLIERAKTPRDKPCSGIQFAYFEKLIGEKIPADKLCTNEIFNMNIITPDDNVFQGKMRVLNFWRSTFDRWLNEVAVEAGAEFQDQTRLLDYETHSEGLTLNIQNKFQDRRITTKYLIAADGMSSKVRKKLRPEDYLRKAPGGAMNYYCAGESDLDPNALYMVNKVEYAPIMFAWIYLKDDQWVIGTGAEHNLKDYADRFYDYVCERYNFQGEILRKEGFASPLVGGFYLGEENVLLTGDAAGLMDAYRGVAMDNAALSARFAVKAITSAERTGVPAIEHYQREMKGIKHQLEVNEKKRAVKFSSDDALAASLAPNQMLKDGSLMMVANLVNRFLPPEKVITLPL
jgi:flavin-dependent dehydrogenase